MTFRFGYTEAAILIATIFFTLAVVFLPDYDRPPIDTVQNGYRGTAMAQLYNPRTVAATAQDHQFPEIALPPLVTAGPRAADSYQNVQVLGDLSAAQFLRLMTAITAWVSPEQGCNYCHVAEGFQHDDLYTKRVSRWMIHMTRALNNDWANHVLNAWGGEANAGGGAGGAGVNCYTCHRGNNVPQHIWTEDPNYADDMGLIGYRARQNAPTEETYLASLPNDYAEIHLVEGATDPNADWIRVQSDIALPSANRSSIKQAELTYALMMHMAAGLGVNCTYCHNSRNFGSWEESTPQRTTAWHGIEMVQAQNAQYLIPAGVALPPHRLGIAGDAPKVNCTTCHQGVYKPLYGVNAIDDFPGLAAANYIGREVIEEGLADADVSEAIGARLKQERTAAATPAAAPAPAGAPAAATPAQATTATEGDANVTIVTPDQNAPQTPAVPAAPQTPVPAGTEAAPADAAAGQANTAAGASPGVTANEAANPETPRVADPAAPPAAQAPAPAPQ